ncbi:hypothetical protein D6D28_02452 [Aureobasidium pullulans]|uniref:RNA-dependent RNA polymerase n=1 Tax=Aureobasidium pullulans TaxID=5580 RepID=A0A4S8STV8_AURPU|nr:hypothetical protein D6D28_02452 [Aureobasidium pullulans]
MAALDPVSFRSNGGSAAPTTPRGQASKEINIIIETIAQEFGLPLRPRIGTSSPSKRPDGYAERCVDHISFLFFRNRVEMHEVFNQFRRDKRDNNIGPNALETFYTRTRDAAYLEKNKPQVDKLQLQPEFKKPAPKLSLTQTKLIPTIKKSSKLNQVKTSQVDYQPSKDKLLPVNQSFVFDSEPVSRGTKRLSNQDLFNSPQYVRPQKQRRQQPHIDHHFSYKISPSNPSFTSSNQINAASVVAGAENLSFATTVATSFDETDEPWDSSSADYGGDLDLSQVEQIMTSFEQPSHAQTDSTELENSLVKPQVSLERSINTRPPLSATDSHTTAANVQLQAEHSAAFKAPTLKSNSTSMAKSLEHRLVRTLPSDGLFGSFVATEVNHSSFHHLWDSYRLATAAERPFQYYSHEDGLNSNVSAGLQFQRTPTPVWEALTDPSQSANVILKANLNFNSSASADKLLTLSLQPLKCERASRLQRQFGSSRFLYIEVPQIHTFNGIHLKGQESLLKSRFQEWMCTEKEFLGRTWRIFHIQDIKKKHNKDNLPSHRLVLFAVDGPRLKKISIEEMLNWAIPFAKNGYQGFCKAYARLDLFLSQTIPTVSFTHKEVKYIKDTFADGATESEEFNDRRMKFEYHCGVQDEKAVMNDGCSLISVGAAKELCENLGIKGVRPVAFQGRINGCKGVWMISAPYDTTDQKHRKRWIHMTDSQRKVTPRDEDLTSNCEPNRWSFELVKYTSTPKPSTLNLDFIPILQNRHVSRDTLQQVIETQLEMDFTAFLESLNDPISLRRWLNSEFSGMEEINRNLGIREAGNFPSDWVEKSILLLESDFGPNHKPVTKFWLASVRSKLKIHLGRSAMALGVADPTGCLKPGEIHMAFSETFRGEASGEVWSHLKGEPKLEYYGIKKDTRKLAEVFGSDNNVDRWLSESFKFKLQEDLLGKATKLHGKLAYKENSISSNKVEDLAGLHDLVIDSAKNGYTLTLTAFNNFVRKKLGIKGSLYKPAYESWMQSAADSNDGRLEPNLRHIIDYLLFEVVNPRIEQLNKDCQVKLADADSHDEDLVKPYSDRKADIDPIIVDVLRRMKADLAKVNSIGNSAEKMTKELYALQASRVLEAYTAVQPNDSVTTRMLPSRYRDSFESVRGNSVKIRSLPLPLSHLKFA